MPLIEYLINMVTVVTIGVVLANVMMEMNILASLSKPMRYLCQASNLPECCMVSVLASTINATAGRSDLAGFYQKGEIGEMEIILTMLISTFPILDEIACLCSILFDPISFTIITIYSLINLIELKIVNFN
jgi:hypothetical protein